MITTRQLTAIVLAAQPLRERLQLVDRVADTDEVVGRRRLDRWRDAAADGDADRFAHRLAWEGVSEQKAARVLGATEVHALSLPEWAGHLARAIDRADSRAEAFPDRTYLEPDKPLAYEGFFVPFVDYAIAELCRRHPHALRRLATPAQDDLARALLQRLVAHGARCLFREESLRRAAKRSSLSRFLPASGGTAAYEAFVAAMLTTDLVPFLTRYAALARQLGLVLEQWLVNTGRLLTRLDADWEDVLTVLPGAASRVAAIAGGLSDLHYQGQSVVALTFDNGRRLFYKPKEMGAEEAYFAFWSWLNDHVDLPHDTLRVVRRDGYGWIEAAENEPCADEAAAHRYYRRSGMLLALLYALETTDCLYENIVAAGECPILVDMETLLHQRHEREYRNRRDDELKIHQFSQELLRHSVMRTGLLPEWYVSLSGTSYDGSGLGMTSDQPTGYPVPVWRHVNTDRMRLDLEEAVMEAGGNVPRVGDRALQLFDYQEEVVAGFHDLYRFLANRGTALFDESPLGSLSAQRLRFIYRNTRDYDFPLQQGRRPENLRGGIERSLLFERLAPALLSTPDQASARQILWAELSELEAGSVPHFTTRADTRELRLPNGDVLPSYFNQTARDLVAGRLRSLDEVDLAHQTQFIRGAIATYARDSHRAVEVRERADNPVPRMPDPDPGPDRLAAPLPLAALLSGAQELAADMAARAIAAPDGSLGWLVLGYDIQTERYRLQPIDFGLYNGRAGVGLFLAALHHVTGDPAGARLASGALQPIVAELEHPAAPDRLGRWLNIGGLAGLGSLVYALLRAGRWLDDPRLLDAAGRAAALITPAAIAADRTLDVTHGAAGALLGLLTLADAGDTMALAQAISCGEHLLATQEKAPTGAAWTSGGDHLTTGFAHGAAGIAYALQRLTRATGDERYLAAAHDAVVFERSLFDVREGNWPDYVTPPGEEPRFMVSWCHGAPGIGLARAAMACMEPSSAVCEDLERAVAKTVDVGVRPLDHLCCGNLGRSEFLLSAAGVLHRPELARIAARQTAAVVQRAAQSGGYRLFSEEMADHMFTPGFFRGTAGIGYSLLRLAQPERVPSVLLLA